MPNFHGSGSTTLQDVADAYPGAIEGHTYLVTGATSGIGLVFSKFIASHGAGTVIITGRSETKLAKALEDVKSTASSSTIVKPLVLDLESEQSVRESAEKIISGELDIPKIDVLVNNAGIFATPFRKIGGYESQFYVNHLSHFLFTSLILSHMASAARVVNVSSVGLHAFTKVRFDDTNFKDGQEYDKILAYGQSKAANILFSVGLSNRFASKGIQSFAVHPGTVITPIFRHVDLVDEGILDTETGTYWGTTAVTEEQGSATYLYAAIAPELEGKGGAYIYECKVTETGYPMTEADANRLWELSNCAFGTSF